MSYVWTSVSADNELGTCERVRDRKNPSTAGISALVLRLKMPQKFCSVELLTNLSYTHKLTGSIQIEIIQVILFRLTAMT